MASNGNPIDRIPQKKLSKRALGKLSAFFSPADVVDLMDKSNWSLEKGIQVLAAIAQDENAASAARITSVRVLNQIMVDALTRSGLLAMATRTITSNQGDQTRFSGNVVSSVLQGHQDHTTIDQLTKTKESNDGQSRPHDGGIHEERGNEEEICGGRSPQQSPAGEAGEAGGEGGEIGS